MTIRNSSVVVAAVAVGGFISSAQAQQGPGAAEAAAQASGTTLPPVVIAGPREQAARTSSSAAAAAGRPTQTGTSSSGAAEGGAPAQTGRPSSSGLDGVFSLGELDMVGGVAISNEAMRTFSKNTLDSALALAPGVVASNSGGSRNEQLIFVRGFDRWQVPISIDGIRIYRPADNRFDFSAFLTPDMSEIQIAKGYTSVLNGPGGLGGAINLVTKKPQKAFEGEVQVGLSFGPGAQYQGYKTYVSLGTKQTGYYAQVSGVIIDSDGWYMSEKFKPTAIENGGRRDHSDKETWQGNVKVGLTPNSTDEYSINYQRSSTSRSSPYHVTDPISTQRYWTWPKTEMEQVYWLSHTKIGQSSYIDTKLYHSSYSDKLFSYDDAAQTRQALPRAFRSYYDDWAAGGSVTAGTKLFDWSTLKTSFHYRRDVHKETQDYNISGRNCGSPPCFTEPPQESMEDTYSVAGEHTLHLSRQFDIVTGASYDWRKLYKAEEFTSPSTFFEYQKKDSDAFNWQAAAIYRLNDWQTIHASISDRTRFPTIFERFSSRFGGATSNPGLAPERAMNYEIGWSNTFAPGSRFATAVFYSDVTNMIQSVPLIYSGQAVTQSQNVGSGNFYGVEAALDYTFNRSLVAGGNITLLRRDVNNPSNPNYELTGVPEVKGFAYLTYRVTEALSVTPNVEFASNRWTSNTSGSVYYKTGAFTLVNLQSEYKFTPNTSLMLTARNIFDQNYVLTDGYPEAGRSFQATMRAKF